MKRNESVGFGGDACRGRRNKGLRPSGPRMDRPTAGIGAAGVAPGPEPTPSFRQALSEFQSKYRAEQSAGNEMPTWTDDE